MIPGAQTHPLDGPGPPARTAPRVSAEAWFLLFLAVFTAVLVAMAWAGHQREQPLGPIRGSGIYGQVSPPGPGEGPLPGSQKLPGV